MDAHTGWIVLALIVAVVIFSYRPQLFIFMLEVLCAVLNSTSRSGSKSSDKSSDYDSKGGSSGGGGASSNF